MVLVVVNINVVGQQSFMRVSKDDFYLPSYMFLSGYIWM